MHPSPPNPSSPPFSEPTTEELLDPQACYHRRKNILEALEFETKILENRKLEVETELTLVKQLEDELETLEFYLGELSDALTSVQNLLTDEQLQILADNAT